MTIERLQCPSCGATISHEGREMFYCSFCGAGLQVKHGTSGNPMAVLAGIRDDTAILAKESTIARLDREIRELKETRADLERQHAATRRPKRDRAQFQLLSLGLFVMLGSCLFFGLFSLQDSTRDLRVCALCPMLAGLSLLGAMVALMTYTRSQTGRTRQELEGRMRAVDSQAAQLQHRRADLARESGSTMR